jgi:hypothetical protein
MKKWITIFLLSQWLFCSNDANAVHRRIWGADAYVGGDWVANTMSATETVTAATFIFSASDIQLNIGILGTANEGNTLIYDSINAQFIPGEPSIASIDTIQNVSTGNKSVGQVLAWNAGASIWEASTQTGGGTTIAALKDIPDVSAGVPLVGQVIAWNAAASIWEASTQTGGGAESLSDLTDVTLSSPVNGEILEYDGAAWVNVANSGAADGKAPTYIIAAVNALNAAGADYTCDGVDDQAQIQAAIDQINAVTGGWVYLTEGDFNLTAPITLSGTSFVRLSGAGHSTKIHRRFNSGTASGVINLAAGTNKIQDVEIASMRISGASTTYTAVTNHGIYGLTFAVNDYCTINIHDIRFDDIGGTAIFLENTATSRVKGLMIYNNHIEKCQIGIYLSNISTLPVRTDHQVRNNTVRYSKGDSIFIGYCHGMIVSDNQVEYSGEDGLNFSNVQSSTITGNTIYNCADSAFEIASVANAGYSVFANNTALNSSDNYRLNLDRCTIANNTAYGAVDDNYDLSECDHSLVTGNTSASAGDDGFYLTAAEGTIISGNYDYGSVDDAFYIASCVDVQLLGNASTAAGDTAFYLNNNQQLAVTGNAAKNPTGAYGFHFFDKAYDINCVGNSVDGTGTYAIFFDRNVTDEALRCNVLSNTVTGTWTKNVYLEVDAGGINNTAFYNNENADLVLEASNSVLIADNVGEVTAAGTHVLQVLPNARTNPIAAGWDVYSDPAYKTNIEPVDSTDIDTIGSALDMMPFIKFDWKFDKRAILDKQISIDITSPNFPQRLASRGNDGEIHGINSTQLLMETTILLNRAREEIADLKSRITILERAKGQ